nr:hypothetical protein [Tanacetum cinerariifolium]
ITIISDTPPLIQPLLTEFLGDLTQYVPPDDDDDDVDVVDSRSSPFLDGEDDANPSLANNTLGFLHSDPFNILGAIHKRCACMVKIWIEDFFLFYI